MGISRSPVAIGVNGKSGRIIDAPSAIVGSLDEGGAAKRVSALNIEGRSASFG